jgi:hypothetical protein
MSKTYTISKKVAREIVDTIVKANKSAKNVADKNFCKKVMNSVLRIFSEDRVYGYSKEAEKIAGNIDLGNLSWGHRLKGLHFEHANTINSLIDRLLNGKKIDKHLSDCFGIWITTEENKRLDKFYRKDRPDGWKVAYADKRVKINKITKVKGNKK